MSTPLDDVLTPSILFNKIDPADLDLPAAGEVRLCLDEADGLPKLVDEGGNVTTIGGQVLSADPASPTDGTFWVTDDGGSPAAIKLRFRKGGVSYTLAEVTV